MKNQIKITKQSFGINTAFLLEGTKNQIENFHNGMYNHSATNGELHDMGNGKAFYFYATEENVLQALVKIALYALCNKIKAKGMKGGLLPLAKVKAQAKFDNISEGRFLYPNQCGETYGFGTITAEKPSDYCGAVSSGRD